MGAPTTSQLAALLDLWKLAQGDHGGAKVAAKFLLGLYNGDRFPFDLTDLRLMDEPNLQRCLKVLEMDARPFAEVHVLLARVTGSPRSLGPEFEYLAYDWKFKGHCRKDQLPDRAWMAQTLQGSFA